MKRNLLLSIISILVLFAVKVKAQTTGDYRSTASGNWNSASTWEVFDGSNFIAASNAPSSGDGIITIRNGHNVTVTSAVNIDQVVVDAGGILTQNDQINLNDGPGDDLLINGEWVWNNSILNGNGHATIGATGTFTLATTGDKGLDGSSITNNGTLNWQDGRLVWSDHNPTFTNTGTFNINCNNVIQGIFSGGTLYNTGTINKLSSGTTTISSTNFVNTNAINLNTGTMVFAGNTLSNYGSITFNSSTFNFSGTIVNEAGSSYSGTGNLNNNGGNFVANSTIVFPATLVYSHTAATIGGSGNLTINNALTFSGNTNGSGMLTFNGDINWTGGTFARPTTVASGVTFDITTAADKDFDGFATITNNGTLNWQDGRLRWFDHNPTLTNTGTFNINCNNVIEGVFSGGSLNNTGNINKLSNGTTTISNTNFGNTNAINLNAGTLVFNGNSFYNYGSIAFNSSTINFSGTIVNEAGSSYSGSGNLNNNGGNFIANSTIVFPATLLYSHTTATIGGTGNLTINNALTFSGNTNGSGMLTFNGDVNWTGGTFARPTTIASGVTFDITTAADKDFDGFATITNNGTLNWQDGRLRWFDHNPTLTNNGTFNINCNNVIQGVFSGGTLNNTGTINKLSSGTTTISSATFVNTNAMNLNAGTLVFGGNTFYNYGGIAFNSSIFNFSGTIVNEAGSSYSGTGNLNNNGGNFIANSTIVFPATLLYSHTGATIGGSGNLTINNALTFSGNTNGSGMLTFNGNVNWTGGTFARPTTVASGVTFDITTAADKGFDGITITNNGTMNWQDGRLLWSDHNPTLTNNGTFNINCNNVIQGVFSGGTLINTGTINKLSSGTTTISNTNFVTTGSNALIQGIGTFDLNTTFTNNGTIAPGTSPGIITLNGAQPLSASSTLSIEVLNTSGPGTGHDQLERNSNLTLGGTLTVTPTGTVPSGIYTIINLTSGVISGSFATVNLPPGCSLQVNATTVTVTFPGPPTWYADADNDTYGNLLVTQVAVTQPSGYVLDNTDCNDANANIHPGATEICSNGIDDNCDGLVDLLLPSGLKLYLPFNGNANDASGLNHNPTFNNATLTTDRFGNINSAYNFNGSSSRIEIPDHADFHPTDITLSGWLNFAGTTGQQYQAFISKAIGTGQLNSFVSAYDNNNSQLVDYFCNNASCAFTTTPLAINTGWFHYATTFDDAADQLKLYINGVLVSTISTTHTLTYDNNPLTIGSEYDNNALAFFVNGKIDDVTLFNRALSASEILQLYNGSSISEICNGIDDNCNGLIDEGLTATYYQDLDNDGFGNPLVSQVSCTQPSGYVLDNSDCNDAAASINPGATEICDGLDNDCDGLVDTIITSGIVCGMATSEGQSFTLTAPPGRVFTSVDFASYGTPDGTCGNFTLGSCHASSTMPIVQGLVIGQNSVTLTQNYQIFGDPCSGVYKRFYVQARYNNLTPLNARYYVDADADGFGNPAISQLACTQPSGYVLDNTDCNDANANIHPGATEIFNNGIDEDCSGADAISGAALSFDGVNDLIYSTQQQIAFNNFTIEAWVNPAATTTIHSQGNSGAYGQSGTNQFVVFPVHGSAVGSGSANAGMGFSVGTNGVCVMEHGDSYIPSLLSYSGAITGWTHVAIVYTNKQPSLYLNGVLVATGLTSLRTNVYATNSIIGGEAYGHFNGQVDEIRIWNSVRTPAEIQANMNCEIPGAQTNLVANYHFNQGVAGSNNTSPAINTLIDASGNNFTGTLLNFTLNGATSNWVAPSAFASGTICTQTFYADADNDTYGNPAVSQVAVTQPLGYVLDNTDCNDANANIHPGATEICDGFDNDCDGTIDLAKVQGIQLYLPLNGNADDLSGNALNGTIIGTVTPATDRFGNPNGAMSFPGNTGSYIQINDNPLLHPASITLAAWVNLNTASGITTFIDKSINCINDSWHFGTENGNYSTWVANSTSCGDLNQTVTPLSLNVWKHIVYTLDATTHIRRLYIDGIEITSGAYNSNIPYDGNPVLIGAAIENGSLAFPLNGVLDDVLICNRALTGSEVTALFNTSPIVPLYSTYYNDADADGFGDINDAGVVLCNPVAGKVLSHNDCNDNNNAINPGAAEILNNGIDEDCSGADAVTGAALNFDGADDFILLPSLLNGELQFTIEYWIKTTESGSNGTYWNRPTMIGVANPSSPDGDFGIITNGGLLGMWNGLSSSGDQQMISSVVINDNQWHHVAVTTNGTTMTLYADGILAGTLPANLAANTAAGLNIGALRWSTFSFPHQGSIDELRLWNRALSITEIQSNMNCEISTPRTNLVANYHFNQGIAGSNNTSPAINTLVDASGNNNTGTLNNFTLNGATSNWIAPSAFTSGTICTQTFYADADNDTYGNPLVSQVAALQPVGYVLDNTDCNDAAASIHPGAPENCTNGIDDDCDGQIDEFLNAKTIVLRSGNGIIGQPDSVMHMLVGPNDTHFSTAFTPADFTAAKNGVAPRVRINDGVWIPTLPADPLAKWIINPVGDESSGLYAINFNIDNPFDSAVINFNYSVDNQLGGGPNQGIFLNGQPLSGTTTGGNQVAQHNLFRNDIAPLLQTGSNTLYVNATDQGSPAGLMFSATITVFSICNVNTYYADADNDTYGNPLVSQVSVTQPSGYVLNNTDCNDASALEFPGQVWFLDLDNDGYKEGSSLIQCTRPANHKAASELLSAVQDCNDNNANINPGATELCNGIDDNCDGQTDEGVAIPTANAGPDQTICTATTTMAANTASPGSGVWTKISGTGTITTPSSPTTTVTGIGNGTTVLRWTITKDQCTSFDEVTININIISSNHFYRSKQNGNWIDPSTWEIYDGCGWVNAVTYPVNTNSDSIVISRNTLVAGYGPLGNTIFADQLYIDTAATLFIGGGTSGLIISNGLGIDLTCNGTLIISPYNAFTLSGGTAELSEISTLKFTGGVWANGTFNVRSGCDFQIKGGYVQSGLTINNYSTSTWLTGGLIVGSSNIHFNNYGIINIDSIGFFKFNFAYPNVTLTNFSSGVINKNNAYNVSLGGLMFNNQGNVNVNNGSLGFASNAIHGGSYNVSNGATISSSNFIFIGTTITNNGLISGSALRFQGSNTQYLNGSGTISDLEINNSNGVILGGNQVISNSLQLWDGKITLGNNNLTLNGNLLFYNGYGNASSYIITNGTGFFKKSIYAATAYLPVGTATSFYPVVVNLNNAVNDTISVRVIDSVYNNYDVNQNPVGNALTNYALNKTWFFSKTQPSSSADITLQWNGSDELTNFNRSSSRVGSYTGGVWNLAAPGTSAGSNPYTKILTGVTSFSPFSIFTTDLNCINSYTPKCSGEAISISYITTGNFAAGNVFTAQLSDNTGSFAAPVNIGSVASSTSGTIAATIPLNTTTGFGYRVRVVPSSPVLSNLSNNGSNITIMQSSLYYLDSDNDGYGAANDAGIYACSPVAGRVLNNSDCNDASALEFPGQFWVLDLDNDGYQQGAFIIQCARPVNYKALSELVSGVADCNDNNANINPGATEICNGIDDDCDGSTDEGVAVAISNAGPDQTICTTTANMAANSASPGTGLWTLISGTATITTPASPTTTVTGISGSAVLRWTITKDQCTSFDEVTISNSLLTGNPWYRSKQSGNWHSASTWEIFNGCNWTNAVVFPTTANSDSIIISRDDTVTSNQNINADQLYIDTAGVLIPGTFIVYGTGAGLVCNGTIILSAGFGMDMNGKTAEFKAGSTFKFQSGQIGDGTFNIRSGCNFEVTGNGGKHFLPGLNLNNYSTCTWRSRPVECNSSNIFIHNYGTINIDSTGFLDTYIYTSPIPNPTLINHTGGIINKNGNDSLVFCPGLGLVLFTNQGNVNINDGVFVWRVHSPGLNNGGNYTIANGATLTGTSAFNFTGTAITNNGTISLSGFYFNGSSVQNLNGSGHITDLEINNSSGVTLGGPQTIHSTLTLTNGNLTLGNNTLTLLGNSNSGSASSYIVTNGTGFLKRFLPVGVLNRFYPVGTLTSFAPVTIDNDTYGAIADTVSCRVIDSVYNNYVNFNPIGNAISNAAVNKTWIIPANYLGGYFDATFQWNAGDELSGFNRNSCRTGIFNGIWVGQQQGAASGAGPYSKTVNIQNINVSMHSIFATELSCTNTFTPKCSGSTLSIPYTASGYFAPGNVFTAKLSNSSGGFSAPVNIGSVASTTSGTINATIPLNTPTGSGYRVWVEPSSPLFFPTDNGSNISINQFVSSAVQNVQCKGLNTGNVNLTQLTVGSYSFLWNTGKTTEDISNLFAGVYTVTVSNGPACTVTASFNITQPATVLTMSVSKTNIRCGGKSTGTATASPTGGVAPYSYQWSNGFGNSATATGLSAATYTVTVTDAAGCSKTKSVVLTQNPALILIATPAGSTVANASASGGTAPYTYSWNTTPAQTNATATGLTPNTTYKVKVTDALGCTKVATVTTLFFKLNSGFTETLSVSPNPAKGLVTISGLGCMHCSIMISLTDVTGRLIYMSQEIAEFGQVQKDFGYLTKGVYTLKVETDKSRQVIKMIIE